MAKAAVPLMPAIVLLLVVVATLLCDALSTPNSPPNQCVPKPSRCRCSRKAINVTIIAKNILTDRNFEQRVSIRQPQGPLLYFLEAAAELNGAFNFSASYHGSLGYMVNTINGVTANVTAKTYWNIRSVTNRNSSLLCGVSTYIPRRAEVILFNFTTWG